MSHPFTGAREAQRAAIGAYIRSQRELASLSLRELARLTQVSNAYLSQIERGLHDPSARVLVSIAGALKIPVEDLLQPTRRDTGEAGGESRGDAPGTAGTEAAIRNDPKLSTPEKEALLSVYRSYVRHRDEE